MDKPSCTKVSVIKRFHCIVGACCYAPCTHIASCLLSFLIHHREVLFPDWHHPSSIWFSAPSIDPKSFNVVLVVTRELLQKPHLRVSVVARSITRHRKLCIFMSRMSEEHHSEYRTSHSYTTAQLPLGEGSIRFVWAEQYQLCFGGRLFLSLRGGTTSNQYHCLKCNSSTEIYLLSPWSSISDG